ncbi:alkaline phosphatase D family protein [Lacimicrobium alkaliphilum]|uniref:PhoD-like phosphatase metallophosphatase domain-containing protein n=1 Tax=Lacimicrobium alkaliphilum TaxID=1526571 RepID=A0ABQ1R992_9ALTE|nr:alkaline phosphatase D family protein [Lacimicrobium alkaliphilum]GGD59143.1 hypothetical protein GCM10011357_13040 [Lacimicrobium alkaliphilum]
MIRLTLLFLILVFSSPPLQAAPTKILFGSCSKEDQNMPIFEAINAEQPDLFMFLGDNIYADTTDMQELAAKYQQLGNNPGIKMLRRQTPVIAIWDDHDYGENDAGREYTKKQESRKIMLDFWNEPADSVRRNREDGIYTSYTYTHGNNIVRVIMPDLRWNRPPLNSVSKEEFYQKRNIRNMGPYSPHTDPQLSMLGESQWKWLEEELKKPATVRIIASSLQLLAEFTGWESWANFPADRQRLISFIQKQQIGGVLIVSGDTHWGEVSKLDAELSYPLWEVTSSGLTEEWKQISPNRHRIGEPTHNINYGYIEIDWQQTDPLIQIGLRNVEGEQVTGQRFHLSTLSPRQSR